MKNVSAGLHKTSRHTVWCREESTLKIPKSKDGVRCCVPNQENVVIPTFLGILFFKDKEVPLGEMALGRRPPC